AAGDQPCLVLLGCDPLADATEPELAATALAAATDVIAVTGHGGPVLAHASIVLPACVAHERAGTTTNLEGRVTRLGQKVVAAGLAWPDTDIAAELAAALGDTGLDATVDVVTDEIAALCATHSAITAGALAWADDGVVVGRTHDAPHGRREPLDPVAFPGVQAPMQDGLRAPAGSVATPAPVATAGTAPRAVAVGDLAAPPFDAPPHDAYSLRLVAARHLYDRGAAVEASPSLHALVGTASVAVNPYDLDRIGVHDGEDVQLRSSRAVEVLRCVADDGVVRGTLVIGLNLDAPGGTERVVSRLMDPNALVTEVRMESL
ncbi:MAG TPA: molybdopterin-dependent oxidoreductase, partial [Acidimicrobiales bacterium]|nr:molybdopterin-dependent oxidoreductase [Acidimicrobiales bacterium]